MRTARLLAGALSAVALAGGLAACGDDDGGDDPRGATAASTTAARTPAATTSAGAPAVGAAGQAGVATGAPGSSGRPFASDAPWNTRIEDRPTDARSSRWIALAAGDSAGSGLFVNTSRWSVPVVTEEGGRPTRVVCRQLPAFCGDGRRVRELPVPPGQDPRPEFDGWFTVLDRPAGVAYDLWRARRGADGVISYQLLRRWDLGGRGAQAPGRVGARASGLPLFAGLITPDEVAACRIEHALAISVPEPAGGLYVAPASSADPRGSADALPLGARLRLRPGVRLDRLPDRTNTCAARAVTDALRRYGAIVVDRARVPTLYAQLNHDWTQPLRDARGALLDGRTRRPLSRARLSQPGDVSTPQLRGNEVEQLRLGDFEVVQAGELRRFPGLRDTGEETSR